MLAIAPADTCGTTKPAHIVDRVLQHGSETEVLGNEFQIHLSDLGFQSTICTKIVQARTKVD
jgi:hypothetical protein